MEVDQLSELSRPLQPIYGRRKAAISRFGDAAASSSSPQVLISSPSRSMQGDITKDDDPSCNTTVSPDDDDEHAEDGVALIRKYGVSKRSALFQSDDDDDDDDDGSGREEKAGVAKEGESDSAYLKRFRESRGAKLSNAVERAALTEVVPSSSLSDPPPLSNSSVIRENRSPPLSPTSNGEPAGDKSRILLPSRLSHRYESSLSPELSPSPRKATVMVPSASLDASSQSQASISNSPYITEAQKQHEERMRKASRETKIKELARRRAKERPDALPMEVTLAEEVDDEVESSTSDIQEEVDDEDLPSAMKAIQDASRNRRLADDRKKALEEANKASRKSKGSKVGVLQMRVEDDSDSDLDFERSKKATEKERPIKALSKKEEEQMYKTQARIERELKASNAKASNIRSERPTFGLSDLLSTFGELEGSKKNNFAILKGAVRDADDPNNSDPIESGSEGEDSKTREPSLPPISFTSRPTRFTPLLKDLSPEPTEERRLREDSEDLPDEAELRKDLINRIQKTKLEVLKEKKAQALLRALADARKEDADDDDDVLLIDIETEAGRMNPTFVKPQAQMGQRKHKVTRLGSPVGLSDEDSQDDFVTDGQIHRAGKALRLSSKVPQAPEKKPSKKAKSHKSSQEATWRAEDLNENIMKKVRLQNIEMRRKREVAYGRKTESQKKVEPEKSSEDVEDMVQRLKRMHEQAGKDVEGSDVSDADGSEYNPDGSIQGEEEDVIDLGSGEEDDHDNDEDEGDVKPDSESEAGSNDSEKENSAPASQDSGQVRMPRRPRIVIEDDEEEEMEAGMLGRTLSQGRSPLQPIDLVQDDDDIEEPLQNTSPLRAGILDGSSEDGFSQFFQDTQVPAAHAQIHAQITSTAPRNVSSTLGKFFEDTQPDQPLRGESFPVLNDALGDFAMPGFTQLFNEGTQMPQHHDSRLMPPPNTSAKGSSLFAGADQDGFTALRKAQESEAQDVNFDTDDLPSLEQVGGMQEDDLAALEMEALQAEIEERQSKEKKKRDEENVTYINKDGFFTQTKPEFERYSLSQSQSQDQRHSQSQLRIESQSQSLRAQWNEHGSSLESRVEPEMPVKTRKRFRRAISMEDVEEQDPLVISVTSKDEEESVGKVEEDGDITLMPQNAFDVLKGAMVTSRRHKSVTPPVKGQKSRFVQGEAEESDDEDEGPSNKKHKARRGGLGGVFSDDEGGSDEEEDDEEDGADLEELIDEEKDDKEAERDILARERYFKDMEADDQAALALHEKATRGGLRNKKRAVNLDGTLEGFLDDDYEDEWIERQVKNPYGNVIKKRKLEGKDGLDLLEANEETQAFVRKYRDVDEEEMDLEKYSFLLPADVDEEAQGQEGRREGQVNSEDDGEADEPQIMTRQDMKEAVAERRKKKKKQAVGESDDEDDTERIAQQDATAERLLAEERMMQRIHRDIYGHSSDEEDEVADDTVRDRLRESRRSVNVVAEDEEEAEAAYSELSRIAKSRSLSEREQQRLLQLQSEYANEPEWGNQDGTRKSNASTTNGTGSSVTSFGSRRAMTKSASNKSVGNAVGPHLHRVRSKLTDVMSRQSHFSESQDD